jgi:hypothetical protein
LAVESVEILEHMATWLAMVVLVVVLGTKHLLAAALEFLVRDLLVELVETQTGTVVEAVVVLVLLGQMAHRPLGGMVELA